MDNLRKGVIIKGGTCVGFTGRGVIPMTQEEFNALPPEKQLNGSYYITDGTDEIVISDNEISEKQLWSSQKISDEIAEVESKLANKENVYTTNSIANTLYYACEYFGLDCRNQYQVLEIEVIDAKGQNLKFNSIYKHKVLHHAQVISENGITLKSINNIGTLEFKNASDYTIKVKYIDICPDSVGDTLVSVINRANKNALVSDINPTIDISKVFSNDTLNISTLYGTYGNGRYVIVGQGTAGNGSATIDIWTLASKAISYIVNVTYSNKTSNTFIGLTYENPTVNFETNYLSACNHIAKVCTLV